MAVIGPQTFIPHIQVACHNFYFREQLSYVYRPSPFHTDPRVKASDNGTVLHWACASEKENRELVKLLLQK